MKRAELLRHLVMNAMADDYEEFDVIHANVADDSERCGVPFDRSDTLHALIEVVHDGLAKAYRFEGEPEGEMDGVPPIAEIETPFTI